MLEHSLPREVLPVPGLAFAHSGTPGEVPWTKELWARFCPRAPARVHRERGDDFISGKQDLSRAGLLFPRSDAVAGESREAPRPTTAAF